MEVSTVSPLSTSLTKGPGPCGIDVTNVAIHGVTLLICLCGLAGNGAVMFLLRMKPITYFIFHQTINDFLFLMFMVPSALLFLLEDLSCSAIMPLIYLSLLFQLSMLSYNMGLFRLTFISIEKCRCVLCPLCCGCQLPERLSWMVMSTLFWAFFFVVIAVNPTVTSLCQSHEHEYCQGALISLYTLYLLLFAAPMVISSTILFISFKPGSQQQQLKRLDIFIFLTALSSLPLSLWNYLEQLGYTVVPSQVFFLLTCIHSTSKPFICFLVGNWRRSCSVESCRSHCTVRSLRMALQRVFEEPEENTACSDDATMDTVV